MTSARRIAYLGPEGTYTDEAAFLYAPGDERVPYSTLAEVVAAVESGEADQAVAPIENSLVGTILDIVDFLIRSDNTRIVGEVLIPIEACLITKPGTRMADIRVVRSKQEALGQCREFLQANLPGVEQEPVGSTAGAVASLAATDGSIAALGPRRAAQINGMVILAEAVQDRGNNVTRFAVLGRGISERTGDDKTSIVFDFAKADEPGLIVRALKLFSDRSINLTKIESRPTGLELGSYHFLLDFEGHIEDGPIKDALEELGRYTSMLKVLGSYPMARSIGDVRRD
jgi:prephenate dehydratase